jgi:flagellar protein FlaG
MIQPISQTQPQMPSRRVDITTVEPVRATPDSQASSESMVQTEARGEKARSAQEQRQREDGLSQETLDTISKDLETLHAVGLNFTQHEGTGRTMVLITNRDTDEVIREIPVKQVLDLAAKIEEMVGMLFDEKV